MGWGSTWKTEILTGELQNFQETEIQIGLKSEFPWCEHRDKIQGKGKQDNFFKVRESLLYFKL